MTWIKKHLYLLSVFLFLPSLFNFFSGDDWFHLRISQISSLSEFFNFFSFHHTDQSAAFYRPLSTQTFFYVFQKLFGLTAWPYYLFVLLCFAFSLFLVYRFALSLLNNEKRSALAALFYGVSVSNFTRVYFLSAFQEISLVIFSLLCLLSFEKSKIKSLLYFVLALLSKETAIVLPVIILVLHYPEILKIIKQFAPFVGLSLVYLYLRFKIFGTVEGDSYIWNFSPAKAANTFLWYTLWSFGSPELLVDYIGSGLRPIPRLFTDYPYWWQTIFTLLGGTVISFVYLLIKKIKHTSQVQLIALLLFFVPLLPVIFLPQHKFPLELGLPLVGFSIGIVSLLPKKFSTMSAVFIGFYLALNLSMNYLTYTRHYSVNRSQISKSVSIFLDANYRQYPEGYYFEFVNDLGNYGQEWGQSKQISQTLSGSDFFKVYYQDMNIKVYYQDVPEERPVGEKPIFLSSKQFIH